MKISRLHPAAFSLVEVALALGVASFALVAIFGLLPVGINTNNSSVAQSLAANLATEIISDMRQAPSAAAIAASGGTLQPMSPRFGINVAGGTAATIFYMDQSGTKQTSLLNASYNVTVSLQAPATGQKTATYGTVQISWPAAPAIVPTPPPLGSVICFVALDRN